MKNCFNEHSNLRIVWKRETAGVPLALYMDEGNPILIVNQGMFFENEDEYIEEIGKMMEHLLEITPSDIVC